MKRYYFIFMLVAGLVSCQRDLISEEESTGSNYPKHIIGISANTDNEQDLSSRGTPITSVQQMTDIGVFCAYTGSSNWTNSATLGKMFNTRLVRNQNNGNWEYSGPPVSWAPVTGNDRYSFFAYAPYATAQNGIVVQGNSSTAGVPSITYTIPANVVTQPDLMLAVPRYNLRPSTSMVALQMKHALTCVGFQIKGNGEQIKSISISGISSSGSVNLSGDNVVWSNLSVPGISINYSALINFDAGQTYFTAQPTMSTNLIAGNGYLMMIPQTLSGTAKLKLTFANNSTREISLNSQIWGVGKKIIYNIIITPTGIITLSPSSYYIPALGVTHLTDNLQLSCEPVNMQWTLSSSASWLRITTNASGLNASQTISGQGAATIYTIADVNAQTIIRVANLYTDGNINNTVGTITQLRKIDLTTITNGGTSPISTTTYVGAFWRANQKGERIIRIPTGVNSSNIGSWTASVEWMDSNWQMGDIFISPTTSLDAGVSYTQDLTPGDAELFKVTDKLTATSGVMVSGGSFYFRIGLNSTYTPTATNPARYAVVVLSHKDLARAQLILLRQGEDADYVMPPTSSITGTRPLARKITTCNLTQSVLPNWVGGSQVTDHPALLFRGGVFADYPTQAGSYFQWASLEQQRRAFHPTNPLTAITNWSTSSPSQYWQVGAGAPILSTIFEVCPPGYRRINDGSETTGSNLAASASEVRQSLLYTLQDDVTNGTTNAVSGYYADGFFDRRQIKNSPTGVVATTVSYYPGTNNALNAKAAYSGMLIYNPVTWASIFLPVMGARDQTGALIEVGRYGCYWTSSTKLSTSSALGFMSSNNSNIMIGYEFTRPVGSGMRCIKVP